MSELIYERLTQIMAEVPAIPKTGRNEAQRYSFRGIDDMYQALHGLFAKHQVIVLPEVLESEYVQQPHGRNDTLATDARLRIRYTFATTDGSTASIVLQGESRDYADKATNQAMSAALKYGLLQMFLIPTEDTVEADHASPTVDAVTADVNHAKQKVVAILGDETAAKAFWNAHSEMAPQQIVDAAKEETAATPDMRGTGDTAVAEDTASSIIPDQGDE